MADTAPSVGKTASRIFDRLDRLSSECAEVSEEELEALLVEELPGIEGAERSRQGKTIRGISIQGVRSYGPQQTLRPSGGLTILYAKNGTGKTNFIDALELAMHGETTRSSSHGNATSEVRDDLNVPHKPISTNQKRVPEPRVEITYTDSAGDGLAVWTDFGVAAARPLQIQTLPRRRLRELTNAKRTERVGALGVAAGLPESVDLWTAISKAVKVMGDEKAYSPNDYISLLDEELPPATDPIVLDGLLDAWVDASRPTDALGMTPPDPRPWRKLAEASHASPEENDAQPLLDPQLHLLLTTFLSIANAGHLCPACEQADVPSERLRNVAQLISHTDSRATPTEQQSSERARYAELAREIREWLDATSRPVEDVAAADWTAKRAALLRKVSEYGRRPDERAAESIATQLQELHDLCADHVEESPGSHEIKYRALVIAIRSRESLIKDLARIRITRERLLPLCKRAGAVVRSMLQDRVAQAVHELGEPVNEWLAILGPDGTPPITLTAELPSNGRPTLSLRTGPDASHPHFHALGYLSDAQIDMLGLAIHLARVERQNPGSLIVIDDPSDMLDSSAREKLADSGISRLLDSKPPHQVIVLTHDDLLVQDLWSHHRSRKPATIQDTIEQTYEFDDARQPIDRYSILVPRTSTTAVERARKLITDFGDGNRDQIWFRAALGSQTRQAVEMTAKDLLTLLGPVGLGLRDDTPLAIESVDLGDASNRVRATLRKIGEEWCDEPRHNGTRHRIDLIRSTLDRPTAVLLNPGAHAGVTLPEMAHCKRVLMDLARIVPLLAPPESGQRSDWVSDSTLARELRTWMQCTRSPGR